MNGAARAATDTVVAAGAITAFEWYRYFADGLAVFMAIGGAVLLGIRLALALREWRRGRKQGRSNNGE